MTSLVKHLNFLQRGNITMLQSHNVTSTRGLKSCIYGHPGKNIWQVYTVVVSPVKFHSLIFCVMLLCRNY